MPAVCERLSPWQDSSAAKSFSLAGFSFADAPPTLHNLAAIGGARSHLQHLQTNSFLVNTSGTTAKTNNPVFKATLKYTR